MSRDENAIKMLKLMEEMPRNTPHIVFSGLSRGELFILNFLYSRGDKVRPGKISKAMYTSTARTAAALGNMERKGWVRRKPDVDNHRQTLVYLTASGRKYIEAMRREVLEGVLDILDELGETDTKEYLRIMERMLEIVTRQKADKGHAPGTEEIST